MSSKSRPKTAHPSSLRARKAAAAAAAAASSTGGPGHRPLEVIDENGVPYVVSGPGQGQPWCPSLYTCLKLFVSLRLSASLWSLISDCDETFNYWEPLHFFIYGKGFQTWEYAPENGLRSYLYILVHTVPLWIYDRMMAPNRMHVFFFLRYLLSFVSAGSEVYFIKGIQKEMGPNTARLTMAVLLFSPGMFISSTAFLPSSTSMYLTFLSVGAWFNRSYAMAILFTAMSAFLR